MKITKTEAREVAAKIFGHNRAEEKEDGESCGREIHLG